MGSYRSEHSGACGSRREVLLQLSYYSTQSQMHQSLIMSLQLLVPLQDINCTRRQNGLRNRKCRDTISEKNSFYWQYSGISLSPTPPECLQTLHFRRPRPGWWITRRCENAADGIWLNDGNLKSSAVQNWNQILKELLLICNTTVISTLSFKQYFSVYTNFACIRLE